MFDGYENRAMTSGIGNKNNEKKNEKKDEKRDGVPSSGKCPNCGALLYYASRLVSVRGTFEDVDYCSGGCGFTEKPGARDAAKLEEISREVSKPRTVAE